MIWLLPCINWIHASHVAVVLENGLGDVNVDLSFGFLTNNIFDPHQIFTNLVHLSLHWEASVVGITNEYRRSSGWFKMNQVWKNLMRINLNDLYIIIFSIFISCIKIGIPSNIIPCQNKIPWSQPFQNINRSRSFIIIRQTLPILN